MKLLLIISTTAFTILFLWICGKSNAGSIPTLKSTRGEKLLSNQDYLFLDVRPIRIYMS